MARQFRSTVEAKTLAVAIDSDDTSITLNSITTLPSAYPYTLVIDPDTASEEIVSVTASGGGYSLTVERGQDGTTGVSHGVSAVVKHMITARDLQEVHDHAAATSGKHGITGSFVGTTDSQTLTNKTITAPVIAGSTSLTGTITGGTINPTTLKVNGVDAVAVTGTQTLEDKSISLTDNTISGTIAEFNTAVSDANFATLAGTEDLTNKTITNAKLVAPSFNEVSSGSPSYVAMTATSTELNTLDGITASTAELNILDGVTASTAELNILDGATLTTAELNYVDGVTSSIQTQINNVLPVGSITMWVGASAPTNWLICNGGTFSGATYPLLETHLGGTTLPDLVGRVPIGAGDSADADVAARTLKTKYGTDNVTVPVPYHRHGFDTMEDGSDTHDHSDNAGSGTPADSAGNGTGAHATYTDYAGTNAVKMSVIQPSYTVNFIIKAA